MRRALGPLVALAALAGCFGETEDSDRPESALEFPEPDRPVAEIVSNQFSNEGARDERGEAQKVMDLANIEAGMTVADIGAGEGYYTVRLAERVGAEGRVTAQDIDAENHSEIAGALDALQKIVAGGELAASS